MISGAPPATLSWFPRASAAATAHLCFEKLPSRSHQNMEHCLVIRVIKSWDAKTRFNEDLASTLQANFYRVNTDANIVLEQRGRTVNCFSAAVTTSVIHTNVLCCRLR
jgi:hypothetical protein